MMVQDVAADEALDVSGLLRAFRAPSHLIEQWRGAEPVEMSMEEVAADDTIEVIALAMFAAGDPVMVQLSPGVWSLCEVMD